MLLVSFALLAAALSFKPLCSQAYLFAAVFFAALMDGYLSWTRQISWPERVLAPVGLVSYSLYLWHLPIILLLVQHLGVPLTNLNLSFIYLPLTVVILVPIVVLSYLYIEVGVPRWIKRRRAASA
jgi:peptidoglycan/LPS O-acetylase OafA/YrhL